jgi:hypothetical protein
MTFENWKVSNEYDVKNLEKWRGVFIRKNVRI